MKISLVTLCLLIFLTPLYPKDIVQIYRQSGIDKVEKIIQQKLTQQSYWREYLESVDVSNGYYESIKYLVLCQKDKKDMALFDTKTKEKLFHSSVFTGENNGDKQIEGDLKTPVGAYNITQRLTNVDPFYGPLALTTNYPNIYDKARGKTGHGIWIHGVPKDKKRDAYTKGCIALDNRNIKQLDKKINIDNSVLIISEKMFKSVSKDDLAIVLSSIFQWRDAWKYSDIDRYISFYDRKFIKSNGYDKKKFRRYKTRLFKRKGKKTIKFTNINVIPYPNTENKKLFKVYMDELYRSKTYKFVGKKVLYLEVKDGTISILTES